MVGNLLRPAVATAHKLIAFARSNHQLYTTLMLPHLHRFRQLQAFTLQPVLKALPCDQNFDRHLDAAPETSVNLRGVPGIQKHGQADRLTCSRAAVAEHELECASLAATKQAGVLGMPPDARKATTQLGRSSPAHMPLAQPAAPA